MTLCRSDISLLITITRQQHGKIHGLSFGNNNMDGSHKQQVALVLSLTNRECHLPVGKHPCPHLATSRNHRHSVMLVINMMAMVIISGYNTLEAQAPVVRGSHNRGVQSPVVRGRY
jgi:hypothetical protein